MDWVGLATKCFFSVLVYKYPSNTCVRFLTDGIVGREQLQHFYCGVSQVDCPRKSTTL